MVHEGKNGLAISRVFDKEINPFELPTIFSANADDYAATVITLLGTMKREDPKRKAGLLRIKQWVEKALAGEVELPPAETEGGVETAPV